MDIYVIPPLSGLDLINKGDRVFVLAQLWLRHQEYRDFIRDQKTQGKWITLDNGVGDHDFVSQEQLLDIVGELMPNEVIALDVLYNKDATVYNLERFVSMMNARGYSKDVEIFAVPQGKDLNDWLECYSIMMSHHGVSTIGLSKIAIPNLYGYKNPDEGIMESRHALYKELKDRDLLKKPLHCLGAGDPREFLKYINEPMYRSTDSCFSVLAGMNNISWHEGNFERIPTPKDYFLRTISEEEIALAESNIGFLKMVVNKQETN